MIGKWMLRHGFMPAAFAWMAAFGGFPSAQAAAPAPAVTRDFWSYDRSGLQATPEEIAAVKQAVGKPIAIGGWADYDFSVSQAGVSTAR